MKSYSMTFYTETVKRGMTVKVTIDARLNVDNDMKLGDIADFEKQVKKIYAAVKNANKCGNWCKVTLCIAEYDGKTGEGRFLGLLGNQTAFDAWESQDIESDNCGIHFAPDTRYTDASNDIYVDFKKSIFSELEYK